MKYRKDSNMELIVDLKDRSYPIIIEKGLNYKRTGKYRREQSIILM